MGRLPKCTTPVSMQSSYGRTMVTVGPYLQLPFGVFTTPATRISKHDVTVFVREIFSIVAKMDTTGIHPTELSAYILIHTPGWYAMAWRLGK